MQRQLAGLLWLGLIFVGGCAPRGGGEVAADVPGELKRRDFESLPAVEEHLPPIDDGQLSVAPPAGWTVAPRGRTHLLSLAKGKPTELPRIQINAEEPPSDSPTDLTEENVAAFAEQQDAEMHYAAKQGKKKIHEYHLPILLGKTVFVRHVRQASFGSGTPCVVQSLQTIRGGRLYTVELLVQIDPKNVDDYGTPLTAYRDEAYAVAAHLKLPLPGGERNPTSQPDAAGQSAATTSETGKSPDKPLKTEN